MIPAEYTYYSARACTIGKRTIDPRAGTARQDRATRQPMAWGYAMKTIQLPVVAGLFYPADPDTLSREVDELLATATTASQQQPKALIAPHAGYIYSGAIAASAYVQLRKYAGSIRRVVILAPAHRAPFHGLATTSASIFRTPLGDVPVDQEAIEQILPLPQVERLDRAFQGEHALEVQLPFLQRVLDDFCLIPLLVGDCSHAVVAEVIEALWGGPETLIVVSSDLSHYLDYASAHRRDQATTAAIEAMQPARIGHHDACGATPIGGLLLAADRHALQVHTLDQRNSGDTTGATDRVVGYGAFAFY